MIIQITKETVLGTETLYKIMEGGYGKNVAETLFDMLTKWHLKKSFRFF